MCRERRAMCDEPSAVGSCGKRRASRSGASGRQAPCGGRRAKGDEPSAQGQAQGKKPTGPIWPISDSECPARHRSKARGRASQFPLGARAARSTRDGFSSPRGGRGGVTSSPKKIPEPGFLAPTRSGRSVAPVGAPTTGSCWLAGFAGYLPAMEIHSGIVQGQILPRGKQPAKPANQRWLQRPTGKLRAQRLELSTSGLARGAR